MGAKFDKAGPIGKIRDLPSADLGVAEVARFCDSGGCGAGCGVGIYSENPTSDQFRAFGNITLYPRDATWLKSIFARLKWIG